MSRNQSLVDGRRVECGDDIGDTGRIVAEPASDAANTRPPWRLYSDENFRQADEIPMALCRSPMARRKLSADVVSGSIRRCRRKPSSRASRIAAVHAGFRGPFFPLFVDVVSTISAISFLLARRRL